MNESINLLVPFKELSVYIIKCRSKLEEALDILSWATFLYLVVNVILFYLIHNFRKGRSKFRFFRAVKLPQNASRVLLITAHPDDECMFFAPTIIGLKKQNCRIFVLCMSRGKSN
jgi:N-acetylglucosaminylphosphatidylinositol deacetylase